MIPIYKTFLKIKNNTIDIQKELIKDYHSLEHQQTRLEGSYNFKLSSKYRNLILELSKEFINQVNKVYNINFDNEKELDVWAYVSNNSFYDAIIHNHKRTAKINGVYYLNVPESEGGELEFYDNYNNKIGEFKPKTNDLIIFDGSLNHKPIPSSSIEYRIALNMEIK